MMRVTVTVTVTATAVMMKKRKIPQRKKNLWRKLPRLQEKIDLPVLQRNLQPVFCCKKYFYQKYSVHINQVRRVQSHICFQQPLSVFRLTSVHNIYLLVQSWLFYIQNGRSNYCWFTFSFQSKLSWRQKQKQILRFSG